MILIIYQVLWYKNGVVIPQAIINSKKNGKYDYIISNNQGLNTNSYILEWRVFSPGVFPCSQPEYSLQEDQTGDYSFQLFMLQIHFLLIN